MSLVRPLAVVGLSALLGSSAIAQEARFVEIAGSKEFSGRLIARPIPVADWTERGADLRSAQERHDRAVGLLRDYVLDHRIVQTGESVIEVPAGSDENAVADRLMNTGLFQYVEPDWILYPIGCPDDPEFGGQWHHQANRLQSCDAWDLETGSPDIVVGYCDTGVLVTHNDLQLHRREAYNAVDQQWESQGGNVGPVHEHGTQVTGCGSANGDNGTNVSGVGWNHGHRMLRVSNDSSGSSSLTTLLHAARTSIESGDRIASVSYSGVDVDSILTTATYIKSLGGLLVWAAGNDGRNLTRNHRDADDLIVAGATDSSDTLASFSARGPFVDVTAPGVGVLTTGSSANDDTDAVSGTSFACPLTAGLCALIWSANPGLSPDEVEDILKSGCDDLGASGEDNIYGHGRINAFQSVSQVRRVAFDFPGGTLDSLDLVGNQMLAVEAVERGVDPVPGTGVLHVDDGSGERDFPMVEVSANLYEGFFPGLTGADCFQELSYRVSAQGTDGKTYFSQPFTATATTDGADTNTVISVDFESDAGWTVVAGNIDEGEWDRGVPSGNSGGRGDPATDFDGSGACWVTGNAFEEDVDGPQTTLLSPVYDLSGMPDNTTVSYARWFSSTNADDFLRISVSDDAGASWTLVERHSQSDGSWEMVEFRVTDLVSLSDQFQMRFVTSDNPNDSVTEAGIDAFSISAPFCPFVMDVTPESVAPGGSVDVTSWIGTPGAPSLLAVTAIDGVPTRINLDRGSFDADGRHHVSGDIPNNPALSGLAIEMRSLGIDRHGAIAESNAQTLHIE